MTYEPPLDDPTALGKDDEEEIEPLKDRMYGDEDS
jgi:hypothetical protein